MKIHRLNILLLFLLIWSTGLSQLTIKINNLPANTPLADTIYISGAFNNWNEADPDFALIEGRDGKLQIQLELSAVPVSFKFTRGSWQEVEGSATGNYRSNHAIQYQGGQQTTEVDILSWEDLYTTNNFSTATENVKLLKEDFYMPQLNRNRRIWVYLPPGYESSDRRYPVIYLHDGQNTFDAARSFSGEWKVDESLNRFAEMEQIEAIAVAIENGGSERINELSPWINDRYGGGLGDEYTEFIVETLKPFIDERFRTQPEREQTIIAGSSMGGLVSMYAAIEYQETFGKAIIFSPAFWFAPDIYEFVSETGKEKRMKFYLLAGQQEDSGSVVREIIKMNDTLVRAGFGEGELFLRTHPDGQHSEWYWAREFPGALQWLFSEN